MGNYEERCCFYLYIGYCIQSELMNVGLSAGVGYVYN